MEEEKSDISHLLDDEAFAQVYSEALDFKSSLVEKNLSSDLQNLDERYEVKDLLGEGAVKKVYLAFDKLMDRNVALAKIKDKNPDLIDDFLREARLSSTLEHPYISPVYDMGFSEDGLPFFVMKLYDGRNLREELLARAGRKIKNNENITWILDIFLKVCEAVSFAHTKKVLHLDIKPSNIRINDHGEVLLCDWGIARLISGEYTSDTDLELDASSIISRSTLMGEVRGTPGFMAPEQLSKKSICDERTDVFGLGALLKDMISGDPPGRGLSLSEVSCPAEVEAICRKAVSDAPESRYKNVQDLIDDINKYKSGMVTTAEDADSLLIIRKWALRHKAAVAIAVFNVLLIGAFFYVYIRDIQDSKSNLETVVDMLKNEREEQKEKRLTLAQKYYDQSYELYCNSVSSFDFDSRDISQSQEMVGRSLDLDPSNLDAWALSGRLHLIQDQYELAEREFLNAGMKFKNHYEVVKNFELNPDLDRHENKLLLIKKVDPLKDTRLRNHLIFKSIHQIKDKTALMKFAVEATAVVNRLESINWQYDSDTMTLDLSGNKKLRVVYPLKTLRFKRLIMNHTALNSHEVYNLRRIPLKYLDASYTNVKNLERFSNLELEELDLQGSRIENLAQLENANVKVLNIANTRANLSTLKACKTLEKVICSEDQVSALKSIFGSNFDLEIIP